MYTRGTTPANRPAPDNPRSIPRYADPSTAGHPAFPSARKGHSLSTYGDKVYMFGGRSNGYTCAYAYTDILNLGSVQAGREIYPCTNYQPEVSTTCTCCAVTRVRRLDISGMHPATDFFVFLIFSFFKWNLRFKNCGLWMW